MEFVATETIFPARRLPFCGANARCGERLEKFWRSRGERHINVSPWNILSGLDGLDPRARHQDPQAKGNAGKRPCVARDFKFVCMMYSHCMRSRIRGLQRNADFISAL